MPDTREKLVELLNSHCEEAGQIDCLIDCTECLADHLIANGVTVQEYGQWGIIEYDKENEKVFVECDCGAVFELDMFEFGMCYNHCPSCGTKLGA